MTRDQVHAVINTHMQEHGDSDLTFPSTGNAQTDEELRNNILAHPLVTAVSKATANEITVKVAHIVIGDIQYGKTE